MESNERSFLWLMAAADTKTFWHSGVCHLPKSCKIPSILIHNSLRLIRYWVISAHHFCPHDKRVLLQSALCWTVLDDVMDKLFLIRMFSSRVSCSNYSYSNYSNILRYSNLEYFWPNIRTIRISKKSLIWLNLKQNNEHFYLKTNFLT